MVLFAEVLDSNDTLIALCPVFGKYWSNDIVIPGGEALPLTYNVNLLKEE